MFNSKCTLHETKQILMVCLERECEDKRLCCVDCIDEIHCKHQIISLRKLRTLMKQKLQHNNEHLQKGKIYKIIQECEEWFLNKLQEIQSQFLVQMQKCEKQISSYFTDLHHAFTIQSAETLQNKLSSKFNSNEINSILHNIDLCEKHVFGTAKETVNMIKYQQEIFEERAIKIKDEIIEKTKKIVEGFGNMRIASKKIEEPMFFHKIHKSYLLDIEDSQSIVSKNNTQGGRPLQLINRKIDPINNKFSCKIIKNGNGVKSISMGICLLPIVKSMNFTNCLGFRKGTYGIDQASFSGWGVQESATAVSINHSEQSYNNQALPFQIDEGDIMHFQVNFDTMQLIIDKEQEEQLYSFPINLTEHRQIFPYVSLTNQGSSVQIYNFNE